MGFKCGLVGLPNVGKSTLFNALTKLAVPASNYPFCTVDPNFGVVPVQDKRLEKIARIIGSKKTTPTVLEFVDIAGLVENASAGEGLGNQFLSHIQRVDAIAHIIRCFEDENVAHVTGNLDPVRDAKIVTQELIRKDLEWIEGRLHKARSGVRVGDAEAKRDLPALEAIQQHLLAGGEVRRMSLDDRQRALVREMNLITAKPVLFIANVDEDHLQDNPRTAALFKYAAAAGTVGLQFAGHIQAEIAELDEASQREFLEAYGLKESGLHKFVQACYDLLDLITFFTANENEAHAWTIPRGTHVHEAAASVHGDFKEKFIKAEVIAPEDLFKHKSEHVLREQGLIHVHGRDYVVQDGDLIFFRIGR